MLHKPGSLVGRYYQIEEEIGRGGMATVYRATHNILGSQHAIKALFPNLVQIDDLRKRFLQEGKIQARLRHPHIVPVTNIIHEEGLAGLVMDWLDGRDLRQRIDEGGALPPPQAVRYTIQTLEALAFVHGNRIVHRDIKPANLFLETTRAAVPQIRVMDFGIAKMQNKQRTQHDTRMGTLCYMSPEQVRSASQLDHRTDLYSLGAVLFEMLAGQPLFDHDNEYELMRQITSGVLPALPGPPALHPILRRALASNPNDRFQSATVFIEALRHAFPEPLQAHRMARLRTRAAAMAMAMDDWPRSPDIDWIDQKEQHLDTYARESVAQLCQIRPQLAEALEQLSARGAPSPDVTGSSGPHHDQLVQLQEQIGRLTTTLAQEQREKQELTARLRTVSEAYRQQTQAHADLKSQQTQHQDEQKYQEAALLTYERAVQHQLQRARTTTAVLGLLLLSSLLAITFMAI